MGGLGAVVRNLLDGPRVAVRVVEEDEPAPGKILDFAGVDATGDEFGPGGVGVGDDDLDALDGAGRRVGKAGPD